MSVTQERFALFLRAVSKTEYGRNFASADIVASFETSDREARVVIDTRHRPEDGSWFAVHVGDQTPQPEVVFSASSETYDRVLRGEMGIMLAITSRKIVADGNVARAMRLVPAFAQCLPMYR